MLVPAVPSASRSDDDSNATRLPEDEIRGRTLSPAPLESCVIWPVCRSHMKTCFEVMPWFFRSDVESKTTVSPFATALGLWLSPDGAFVTWRRLRGGLLSKRKISLPLLPLPMMSVVDSKAIQRATEPWENGCVALVFGTHVETGSADDRQLSVSMNGVWRCKARATPGTMETAAHAART